MQKMKLTDATIRALKPSTNAYVWDISTPAFGVYVGKNRKTFVAVRSGRRHKLGVYGVMGLAEARDRAKKHLLNGDVANRRVSIKFTDAVDSYLSLREPEVSPGALREYTRHLRRVFTFNDNVGDITQKRILDSLDRISGQSERAHAARALKTFLNWCVQREYLEQNPMLAMKMPKEPDARERVLTDDELKAIWDALHRWPDPRFAAIVRILMLTGQRANQIASLRLSWINAKKMRFAFPKEIMKAGKAHTLPFGEETVRQLGLVRGCGDLYFSPPGLNRPFSAWSKNKVALDKKIELTHWTIHDLRRTWSTNAPRLDIAPDITERVLAHSTPGGSRIAAVYNHYHYEPQMRDAILKMEAFVTGLR